MGSTTTTTIELVFQGQLEFKKEILPYSVHNPFPSKKKSL